MIDKPTHRATEGPLHAAIGHALDDGRPVRKVSRAGSVVYSYSLIGLLMGLIATGIPPEYTLILGAAGAGVMLHLNRWNAERDAWLARRK